MKKNILKILLYARRIVYIFLYFTNFLFLNKKPKIIILCYHSVSPDGWRFSVPQAELEKQIAHLLKSREPASLGKIKRYLNGEIKINKNSFVVTFDDGYKDILAAKNFFKMHGIKPTVFALSGPEKADQAELGIKRQFLNAADLRELKNAGWEIGCHSATHRDFSTLDEPAVKKEIISSKKELEEKTKSAIEYFSYPKGRYNAAILKAVSEAGYALGLTMDDWIISEKTNPYKIPRIGVDNTHSFLEFKALPAFQSMLFRKILKKIF